MSASNSKAEEISKTNDHEVLSHERSSPDPSQMTGLRAAIYRLTGLHLSPLHVPLHRRLETLAVYSWMFTVIFTGPICLLIAIYLFMYTRLWWAVLLYLVFYVYDRGQEERGGRRIAWLRGWVKWKYLCAYFPVSLVKTAPLPLTENYLCGYHPHGIITVGAFAHFATSVSEFTKEYPGLKTHAVTLPYHFVFPGYREYVMGLGLVSSSKRSLQHVLTTKGGGAALALVVGGASESLDSQPGAVVLHLKNRKGFVKLAIRTGASLVPVFGFGETEAFSQARNPAGSRLRAFQEWFMARTTVAPCAIMGRGLLQYTWGFLPHRRPIYTLVGAPLPVVRCADPTNEMIDSLHATYVDALVKLYNAHRHNYPGYEHVDMSIV